MQGAAGASREMSDTVLRVLRPRLRIPRIKMKPDWIFWSCLLVSAALQLPLGESRGVTAGAAHDGLLTKQHTGQCVFPFTYVVLSENTTALSWFH